MKFPAARDGRRGSTAAVQRDDGKTAADSRAGNADAWPPQHPSAAAAIAAPHTVTTRRRRGAESRAEVRRVQASPVRIAILAAIVAAQTLLIGLDAAHTLQSLDRAGWLLSLADGYAGWLRQGVIALLYWLSGALPPLLALALGAVAAWASRRYSATPAHVAGLGRPLGVLLLIQAGVLTTWFRLLPAPTPRDAWQSDGLLIYTLLLVATALLWLFCNALLLWRAAGGRPPPRDAQELRHLREIAARRARAIDPAAPRPPSQPPS